MELYLSSSAVGGLKVDIDINLNMLKDACEAMFNLRKNELFYKSRVKYLVDARTIFVMIAKEHQYTLSELGRYLGLDHTTVIHYMHRGKNLMMQDDKFYNDYSQTKSFIYQNNFYASNI